MNTTPAPNMDSIPLSIGDFKKLNSAVNQLYWLHNSNLRDHLKVDKLWEILGNFKDALKKANREEKANFDRKMEYYEETADSLGLKSTWSIYEVEDMSSTHPFTSAKAIIYKKGHHWGDKDVEILIEGDTWQSLFVAADSAIRMSEDNHHTFIERFEPDGDKLILLTGS
jgi:hypothetical protein